MNNVEQVGSKIAAFMDVKPSQVKDGEAEQMVPKSVAPVEVESPSGRI